MEELNFVNHTEGTYEDRLKLLDLLKNPYAKIHRFRQLYASENKNIILFVETLVNNYRELTLNALERLTRVGV